LCESIQRKKARSRKQSEREWPASLKRNFQHEIYESIADGGVLVWGGGGRKSCGGTLKHANMTPKTGGAKKKGGDPSFVTQREKIAHRRGKPNRGQKLMGRASTRNQKTRCQ